MSSSAIAMKYQWSLGDEFDSPRTIPINKRNRKFRKRYSSKRFKTLTRKILKGFGSAFGQSQENNNSYARDPP